MELELIKKKEFPLLSRTRYSFWFNGTGATPARVALKDEVAKAIKSKPELTVIKHVYAQFGQNKAKIIAHVYESKEKLAVFENEKLIAKHSKAEKGDKEGAAAPAAKAPEKKE
jgi:ribosomal protein S24E